MRITAKVTHILPEASGTTQDGRTWRKASFVIEEQAGTKPNRLMIEVMDGMQGRIERMNLQIGEVYEFFIDAQAREYQGRWYNSITAWDARKIVEIPIPTGEGQMQ